MEEIKIRPTFIRTKNVRNFEALMDGLALGEDDSRLGLVYGRAGRGKSRTAQWYAANHGFVYLFVLTVWRTNETEFCGRCAGSFTSRPRRSARTIVSSR